jgi:starch phosphorylase
MMDKYFGNYWNQIGIGRHEFLDLGAKINDNQNFNMTVLALTIAGRKNGVSELHGAVSRNIFNNVWPGVPEDDVPIGHITNGIHTLTWLSPGFKNLYNKYFVGDWQEKLYDKSVWKDVKSIPDEEMWETHCQLKLKMINFIREKLKEQRIQNGESVDDVREVNSILDPNALTIGFARRFATYKRANLIFRNAARIQKILNDPNMPVQLIFAGKAHPADRPAHEIIKNINDIARQEGFKGKVILVENYNMTVARNLVQGVDIWLYNPRRPLEASGTSGQKVCINGVINFSVLDGWWCEGYNGKNGWTIGDDKFYGNEYYQDNADSESIYNTLENQIIPLYYNRNEKNIPFEWVKVMKESIRTLAPQYSTHRMVQEYTNKMYIPFMERMNRIQSDNFEMAHNIAEWKEHIERNWQAVQLYADKTSNKDLRSVSGEDINLSTSVYLGSIKPSDVKVEIYYGTIGKDNTIENSEVEEMQLVDCTGEGTYRYEGNIKLSEGGEYGYTLRVLPYHPDLINKFEMGLIHWVVQ